MLLLILLFLCSTLALKTPEDVKIHNNLKDILGNQEYGQPEGMKGNEEEKIVVSKDVLLDIFGTPNNSLADKKDSEIKLDENLTKPPNRDSDDTLIECTRDDGKPGVCALYYQCDPETKKLITDGATLIDVRMQADCPNYLQVCCLKDSLNTTKSRPPLPTNPVNKACGYSNFGDEESFRIENDGTKAEFLEYPWIIALLKSTDPTAVWTQSNYLGGGSLIHHSVVLTSAHKVEGQKAEEVICRAGEWDTQTTNEIYPYQERGVKKIVTHEDFYRPSLLNSVALLFLKSPFTDAPNVGLACLGRSLPPVDTKCLGMGWGSDEFGKVDSYAVILKKVELPLFSRKNCQNALRRTRLGSYFILHESLICAGGEKDRDTCVGDGGSPLVCSIGEDKDNRYAVYGMSAYGIGCGTKGIPGVYVNVPEFYSWIEEKIKSEGLDTASFTF